MGHPGYPTDLLEGCSSALMLFCAGFYGNSDCIHVTRAGLTDVVAVDTDKNKINAMRGLYPQPWKFVTDDVYEFIPDNIGHRRYDLVSADPATSDSDRMFTLLPDLCALADRLVILGVMADTLASKPLVPPGDWGHTRTIPRNSVSAKWLVLQR